MALAATARIVTSEITASHIISIFARGVSGTESAALNAVAVLNEWNR